MRVTEKDKEIYKFIGDVGFATVKQVANVFFNDIIYRNELAKKRISCLVEHGYVKQYKAVNCSQHIFCVNEKLKRQTYHNILVMDLYSKFLECRSVDVLDFTREKAWDINKVISDAFMTVKYKKGKEVIIQNFIVEIQVSNNDWKKTLEKYNNTRVDKEIRAKCSGYEPVIILVDEVQHNLDLISCPYQIVQIDTKMTDFPLVFNTN